MREREVTGSVLSASWPLSAHTVPWPHSVATFRAHGPWNGRAHGAKSGGIISQIKALSKMHQLPSGNLLDMKPVAILFS